MTEATLTRNMVKDIKARGGVAKKSHGGPNMAGWPDICGCYRGYTLAIEVKLPGRENTLTKLQQATLDEWAAAGAIAKMVTTRQQVKAILDAVDRKRDG